MTAGWLEKHIVGSLYGGALGDALGGPVEGWPIPLVEEVHGGPVTGLLPYLHKDQESDGWRERRGAGCTTDDTHFKNILCQAIVKKQGRVDAEDFARELPVEDPYAYLVMRMALLRQETLRKIYRPQGFGQPHVPTVDTAAHHGGSGLPPANGAVMMMSPVGLLYPGEPRQAYLAGYEIGCAVQQGYSADMAGVVAAGVAAAMTPETNAESVVQSMIDVAPAAAAALMEKSAELAAGSADLPAFRSSYTESLLVHFLNPAETVAIVVGCLLLGEGRFVDSTLNAVNFGRDCDSSATVAGAIAGALEGIDSIPSDWIKTVDGSRGDEPSQGELATGICEALKSEFERTRVWLDRYEGLV